MTPTMASLHRCTVVRKTARKRSSDKSIRVPVTGIAVIGLALQFPGAVAKIPDLDPHFLTWDCARLPDRKRITLKLPSQLKNLACLRARCWYAASVPAPAALRKRFRKAF